MNLYYAKIEGDTWTEKLQISAACKCCDRHNTNKPQHLAPWVELPFNNTDLKPGECNCPCRHNARHICRKFNTTICPKYSEWIQMNDILLTDYLTD